MTEDQEIVSPYSPEVNKVLDRYLGQFRTKEEWVEALGKRIVQLESGLDEIINPILYMQRRADASDEYVLDGMWAVKLSNNPGYLQDIARRALDDHRTTNQTTNAEEQQGLCW